jgi:hypothetical protein
MKKLIAIAVVFALAAGAVFAETSISGTVETRFTAIAGRNQDNPTTFGAIGAGQLQFSGSNDDGTVGAAWKLRNQDIVRPAQWWHRAFVWWKPIPQLRVFLGIDQDGMYSTGDPLTDWQFHQGPEDYLAVHDWGFWRGVFPGNWDGFGLSFSIYPVDGLNINLTIPTGSTGWPQATDAAVKNSKLADHVYLAGLKLQANYALPDIGKIFFTYDGPGAGSNTGYYWDDPEYNSFGKIGASFLLEALSSSGLRAQIGFTADLAGSEVAEYQPWSLALGVHYTGEGFGVKFRTAAIFQKKNVFAVNPGGDSGSLPSTAYVSTDDYNETFFTANIMPWFKLDFMSVYIDLGMAVRTTNLDGFSDNFNDSFGWWITPYVKVPLGGPSLEFGLVLRSSNITTGDIGMNQLNAVYFPAKDDDTVKGKQVNYAIPLRFVFSF